MLLKSCCRLAFPREDVQQGAAFKQSVSSVKLGCQMGAEGLALPRLQQGIAPEPVGTVNYKYVGHVTLFRTSALELVECMNKTYFLHCFSLSQYFINLL